MLLRAYRCGVEDVRMRDALGQADAHQVDVTAGIAAARLSRFALPGRRDADAALAAIVEAAAPLESRIDGAGALGQIVGVACLRGAESVAIGPATISLRPEHAGGRVRPRIGAAGSGAARGARVLPGRSDAFALRGPRASVRAAAVARPARPPARAVRARLVGRRRHARAARTGRDRGALRGPRRALRRSRRTTVPRARS